jgi:NADPH2:quinone reductase
MNAYVQTKEEFDSYAGEVMHLLSTGALKITISGVYDLKDAGKAHTDLEVYQVSNYSNLRGGKLLESWC